MWTLLSSLALTALFAFLGIAGIDSARDLKFNSDYYRSIKVKQSYHWLRTYGTISSIEEKPRGHITKYRTKHHRARYDNKPYYKITLKYKTGTGNQSFVMEVKPSDIGIYEIGDILVIDYAMENPMDNEIIASTNKNYQKKYFLYIRSKLSVRR